MTRALALLIVVVPALAHGQSCVTGRVVDADAGQPIAGAAVSADWTEGNADRLRAGRETTTDSLGRYRLCLTSRAAVLVQAIVGTTVAYLPITTPDADTTIGDLRVAAEGDTGSAIVAGHVVSETGAPVEGANVTLLGGQIVAPTGTDGAYGLRGPEGSQVLIVRRIGLGAAVVPVNLMAKRPRLVNIAMQKLPPTLAVVSIVADRLRLGPVYDAIGLTKRARDGHGHIMTLDQIEAKQASQTVQLFEGIPGVTLKTDTYGQIRVMPARNHGLTTMYSYGDCTAYIVDGVLIGNGHSTYTLDPSTKLPRGNEDETTLPRPDDLIAVEVYQPGEPTPVESGMVDRCLKILLWTKALLGKP
jgi:Carboxypeptidase regulatory-like domain